MLDKLKKSRMFEYEFLLFSLLMLLFNKIFVTDDLIYINYIWPLNMILLGVGSIAIYKNPIRLVRILFYVLFVGVALTPFFAYGIFSNWLLSVFDVIVYISFYLMLFIELMRLVTMASQVTINVIFGTVCGYLTLVVIAIFSFLLLEHFQPGSFTGSTGLTVPELYTKMSYYSMITLTTIGYGDITPETESAMLLASFWGIVAQFYMVAVVGIIISKYSSRKVMED